MIIHTCRYLLIVVVDSHIQRIVLATEETTVTQQISHRPIKCQSRLWSQRGTKVNGSHHGDNPLLRPTGIQIATKSYAALQAMAPTNIKTVHQTSLLHIESNLDRLGMLSPTHDQRSQQKNGKITLQPVLINKSKFLKATHYTEIRKIEIPRSMVALVGRKMTVVRHQLFPQKPPGSSLRFSRTGVQTSPGSSTIELPSTFAESGAYPPDRALPGLPRQCSLPLACGYPPEGHQTGARKRRAPGNTILSQPYRRVSTDRLNREGSWSAASLEGEPGPTPAGKTLPHSYPETRFRRERARDGGYNVCMYGHTYSKSMD